MYRSLRICTHSMHPVCSHLTQDTIPRVQSIQSVTLVQIPPLCSPTGCRGLPLCPCKVHLKEQIQSS